MSWTHTEKAWLFRHYHLTDEVLAQKYFQTFRKVKSVAAIKKFRQRYRLTKDRGKKK
jgi:hypothetical protein